MLTGESRLYRGRYFPVDEFGGVKYYRCDVCHVRAFVEVQDASSCCYDARQEAYHYIYSRTRRPVIRRERMKFVAPSFSIMLDA